jgi:DNA-binding PadR family transcriptional regulator
VSAVFSHGRLRLYLLKLLEEGPKHGYELIRLLENRFHGLYAPSAGTIYPRLARMEADGLITHTASGGRKVYDITDAGRGELAQRTGELARLESEIHASVADLAALAEEVEEGVRGSVRDLKRELRQAKHEAQVPRSDDWRQWRDAWRSGGRPPGFGADQPGADQSVAPATEVERKAADLAAEVRRLVGLGRAAPEDLRVAATVLDSVRDQLRHILRG